MGLSFIWGVVSTFTMLASDALRGMAYYVGPSFFVIGYLLSITPFLGILAFIIVKAKQHKKEGDRTWTRDKAAKSNGLFG